MWIRVSGDGVVGKLIVFQAEEIKKKKEAINETEIQRQLEKIILDHCLYFITPYILDFLRENSHY